MRRAIIFSIFVILAAPTGAFAQDGPATSVVIQGMGILSAGKGGIVTGAPYSATMTNASVQTLADGTRIEQSNTGSIARDSQGRTRQDAPLPSIGNLSAENAPHMVFIMDPVAQVSYTLNLTEKTAQKMPMPPGPPSAAAGMTSGSGMVVGTGGPAGAASGNAVYIQSANVPSMNAGGPPPAGGIFFQKTLINSDSADAKTEDLGTQTMEGLLVAGTRTTHTIPAGQIGNDRPLSIVTEVWTSPDLKTIISSKRSDPRMGDQTFQLTNITRAEPDASLFTVPPDFKIVEGPQKIMYGINK